MGGLFIALGVAHMVLWWAVYAEADSGVFPQDVLRVPMAYPCNGPCDNANPKADNFTIQMMTLVLALVLVCMGGFARYSVRRRNFEVGSRDPESTIWHRIRTVPPNHDEARRLAPRRRGGIQR